MQVTDGYPCGQHILNGPRLTSKFCHEPTALRCNICQGDKGDTYTIVPLGQGGNVAFLPQFGRPFISSSQHDGEEEDQETSYTYHDAESPEVDGDVGHNLCLVLDVTITEVFHVLVDGG